MTPRLEVSPATVPAPARPPPQAPQRAAASQATSQASASITRPPPVLLDWLPLSWLPPTCWVKLFMKASTLCTDSVEKPE